MGKNYREVTMMSFWICFTLFQAEIAQLQEQLALKDAEIERLQCQLSRTSSHSEVAEREEVYKRRLKEKHQEVQRLKIGMESLLAANEEKDRRIEELTLLLSQYRRVKEIMIAAQGSSDRIVSGGSEEELEATLRKLNVLSNPQGELFKAEASSGELSPALLSPVTHKTTEIRQGPSYFWCRLSEVCYLIWLSVGIKSCLFLNSFFPSILKIFLKALNVAWYF